MRKSLIAASILALTITAAHAKPGEGNPGKGHGNGGKHAAAAMHGKAHADGPGKNKWKKDDRRGSWHKQVKKDDRGKPDKHKAKHDGRGHPHAAREWKEARSGGKPDKDHKWKPEKEGKWKPGKERKWKDDDREVVRVNRRRDDDWDEPRRWRDRDVRYIDQVVERRTIRRNFVDGCPPGLAKKFNGCMPPGLAKKRAERRYYYRPDYWGYSFNDDRRYFYRDGYLLRLGSNDRISAFIPLLGGALAVGSQWPSFYEPRVSLDPYYVDYFDLGPSRSYRYADNVIYRVNPETTAIMSVAALLTGDQFTVGQPMPAGYGVYNVPFAYRDRYYDRPDALYRYSDGYVYEIEPKTMLVASAISLVI